MSRASLGNTDTAARSLRRLQRAGYVIHHPPSSCTAAYAYSLNIDRLDQRDNEGALPVVLVDVTDLDCIATGNLSHEVFEARNLGKTAEQVYAYLLGHPDRNMAEISRGTGRHKTTVKNALQHLQIHEMAEEVDGLWRVYTRSVRTDGDLQKPLAVSRRRRAAVRRTRIAERAIALQAKADRERIEEYMLKLFASADEASLIRDAEPAAH